MNSIALTSDQVPQQGYDFFAMRAAGFCLVKVTDLLALEAAKHQYELAYLENQSKTPPRSQRDSAPVEQHLTNERQHTEPDPDLKKHIHTQQARITHLLKIINEYQVLLREAIA